MENKGRIKTIQTRTFLRFAQIEESRGPEETFCYLDSSERPSHKYGVKFSQEVKYKYIVFKLKTSMN